MYRKPPSDLVSRVKAVMKQGGSSNMAAKLLKIGRPTVLAFISPNGRVTDGTVAQVTANLAEAEKGAKEIAKERKGKSAEAAE